MRPTEQQLHAYLDGELNAAERQRVAEYLAQHPQEAARLAQFQADAEALRLSMQRRQPEENPALHPASVRRAVTAGRWRQYAAAAVLVLSLSAGWVGGWQWRDRVYAAAELPMKDAVEAYRLFTAQPATQVAQPQLADWFARYFKGAALPPALDNYGLEMSSAELMATAEGPAAMVLYRNDSGQTLLFFIRPGREHQRLPGGQRQDGPLLARYWSDKTFNYALVSQSDSPLVPIPGPFGGVSL